MAARLNASPPCSSSHQRLAFRPASWHPQDVIDAHFRARPFEVAGRLAAVAAAAARVAWAWKAEERRGGPSGAEPRGDVLRREVALTKAPVVNRQRRPRQGADR